MMGVLNCPWFALNEFVHTLVVVTSRDDGKFDVRAKMGSLSVSQSTPNLAKRLHNVTVLVIFYNPMH